MEAAPSPKRCAGLICHRFSDIADDPTDLVSLQNAM